MGILLLVFLQTNPHTTADDSREGVTFTRSIARGCQGLTAEGGRGPNLSDGDFYHGDTDADFFRNVQSGIAGTEMLGKDRKFQNLVEAFHWDLSSMPYVASRRSMPVTLAKGT